MSKLLLSLLPLPPIWEHKNQILWEHNETCTFVWFSGCVCVCVCACSGCTYCAAETAWLKTNWQKTFEAEKKGEKRAHTTTCQERNASNFSVICQPFNKTRALCPHTPPSNHKRQRWSEEEEGRREEKRRMGETDRASDMSFSYLKSFNSLNLLLSLQVVIFCSFSSSPPLSYLRQ